MSQKTAPAADRMKCGVKFLHRFLRSIGFSRLTSTREVQELIKEAILNADKRNYTTDRENGDTILVEFCRDFAENMGIAVCGELDDEDQAPKLDETLTGMDYIPYTPQNEEEFFQQLEQ